MEPIQRVMGPGRALDGVAGVHRLAPVERDEREPGDREQRRRKPAPAPADGVERGEDGRPHVDVRA